MFVTFLGFLDCERSLFSPNFSEKENRTTARSLSVFQSIQFLNVTRLVASGFVSFFGISVTFVSVIAAWF